MIIIVAAAVIFAFVILIYVATKPQYVVLQQVDTTAQASEVINILTSNDIEYQASDDGLTIKVPTAQISQANIALGAAGFIPNDYGIDNVTNGGLSTTASDRQVKYVYYLEKKLAKDMSAFDVVRSANVSIHMPDNTGTLISTREDPSVWIQLDLYDKISPEQATAFAKCAATAMGNDSTANITVVDTQANLLFSGEEDLSSAGIAQNQMELRSQAESLVGADVKKVLVGSKQFDMVEVACRLDIDFAEYQKTVHEYYANPDRVEGMYASTVHDEESSTGTSGGTPGTTSNDETTVQIQTAGSNESNSTHDEKNYLPNESVTVQNLPPGIIDYGNSSLGITALSYKPIKEVDVRDQGLLDGVTWEQYQAQNSGYTKIDVEPDFVTLVSTSTGVPEDKISIVAYEVPQFIDKPESGLKFTDILSIILIVVILGLLAFVVIRSMLAGRKKQEEPEPELSVEDLLQSTPATVEEIEGEGKSETRKAIEKFVDENPEAAANLLRNWLNEDWA